MGCMSSKPTDSKANRLARWRSTGIVGLRDSKLKAFPDEILELDRAVRTLDLTHNRIVEIPVDISKLINMQRLILAENLIERLPMNLGRLQSLKVMTLDGNKISVLPDEFGQLVRLERLSISANVLTSLPETIGSLRNLQLLNVSNTQLNCFQIQLGAAFHLRSCKPMVLYMALVGSFPFNSFLSGVLSCVGTAVLAVCLHIQVNNENKEFKEMLPILTELCHARDIQKTLERHIEEAFR